MKKMLFSLDKPVRYLQSGHFSAELGWQHHYCMHQEDTEIIIGLSGAISITIAGQNYRVESGDVLTVFPHESLQGEIATMTPSEFIWLHFIQQDTYQILADVTRINQKDIFLPRYFHLYAKEKALIIAQQLLDVAHNDYYSAMAADYQCSMLLVELTNDFWQQSIGKGSNQNHLGQIKEWIRSQMSRQITVPEVARHFKMNPDYLTRIFKRELGFSVKTYMNTVKLDQAKYLLLTSNQSVTAISQAAYFQDTKYFMRLFKKRNQLTPSQYRQAYTHTFLNNAQVDPGIDIQAEITVAESQ